ncbi:hypothetical protein ACJMK2_038909 [Sinanodonta woodiana]|uniref:C-type lectin domain-containing protein n=1 Tax=Sinanodonta woodiana TaxID=1069815 RepID=A0ABD3WDS8_SINWO
MFVSLLSTFANLSPACPARYSMYAESCGRFCYRYESSACRTWDNARTVCQQEGGDLLAPSVCNYEFLRMRARQNEGICQTNFWLGARRPAGGNNMVTVLGEAIPNNANFWAGGQPDNADNVEQCMEMRKDFNSYLANDRSCAQSQGFICQIRI